MIPDHLLFQMDPITRVYEIGLRDFIFIFLLTLTLTILIVLSKKILPLLAKRNTLIDSARPLSYDPSDIASIIHYAKHILTPPGTPSDALTAREVRSLTREHEISDILVSAEDRLYKGEGVSEEEQTILIKQIEKIRTM